MSKRKTNDVKKTRRRDTKPKSDSNEAWEVRRARMVSLLENQVKIQFYGHVTPSNTIDFLFDRICIVEESLERLRESCPFMIKTADVDEVLHDLRRE